MTTAPISIASFSMSGLGNSIPPSPSKQAIALKGDDTNSYLRRAELYDKKGNTEQAIADLTRATELT